MTQIVAPGGGPSSGPSKLQVVGGVALVAIIILFGWLWKISGKKSGTDAAADLPPAAAESLAAKSARQHRSPADSAATPAPKVANAAFRVDPSDLPTRLERKLFRITAADADTIRIPAGLNIRLEAVDTTAKFRVEFIGFVDCTGRECQPFRGEADRVVVRTRSDSSVAPIIMSYYFEPKSQTIERLSRK